MSDELTPKESQEPQSEAAAEAAKFLDPDGDATADAPATADEPTLGDIFDAEDAPAEESADEPSAQDLLGSVEEAEEPAVADVLSAVDSAAEAEVEEARVADEASASTKMAGEEIEEEEDAEPAVLLNTPPDDGIRRRWYAIHAHSGQEASVQKTLQSKAEREGLADQINNILVPMEEISEFKSGEKKVSRRKYFPGYILLQLPEHPERNADLWHLIKDTTGVTGFIGSRNEPVPLEDEEVMSLVEEMRGERERPKAKVNYELDERIKIIDGAFANFFGNISEINEERGRMKVMIEIFERQTSVEVEFWQVEKI